jgi:hypothetical protein
MEKLTPDFLRIRLDCASRHCDDFGGRAIAFFGRATAEKSSRRRKL